ncbi:MAG: tRNA (adenosine(37)-N6)-dimethylallyltransferase MiaA [Legionellaceae bacterium]
MHKRIVCLMGPTASGKTALACELVKRFPFEIVSVDSAMIYQGMNIGTAKPDLQTLEAFPHHLIDICLPHESYSAASFCQDTLSLCEMIFNRGHVPLLVGGTMMYFRALQQGLSVLPVADQALRDALYEEAAEHGWAHMHALLMAVDAQAALRIHAHDTQRLIRALEVYRLTEKPLSEHWNGYQNVLPYPSLNLALFPSRRAWLHDRIALRFDDMLAQGFLAEVEGLLQQYDLTSAAPSMRTVGYRQALDYFHGLIDHRTLREQGLAATRQLAKRQLTWLRSWPEPVILDPESVDALEHVIRSVSEFLTV